MNDLLQKFDRFEDDDRVSGAEKIKTFVLRSVRSLRIVPVVNAYLASSGGIQTSEPPVAYLSAFGKTVL